MTSRPQRKNVSQVTNPDIVTAATIAAVTGLDVDHSIKGPVVRGYFPVYLVNFHLN